MKYFATILITLFSFQCMASANPSNENDSAKPQVVDCQIVVRETQNCVRFGYRSVRYNDGKRYCAEYSPHIIRTYVVQIPKYSGGAEGDSYLDAGEFQFSYEADKRLALFESAGVCH